MKAEIKTVQKQVHQTNELDAMIESAKVYNQNLPNQNGYEEELNPLCNGYMATIEIEKINLTVPIYHDSTEDILAKGIGHLPWSSLPVGGKGTHALLTGHSGSLSHSFFTRLDELKIKDRIHIYVADQKLDYAVKKIYTVLPNQIESLQIQKNKDWISLITCTPLGINTHRLIVRCERVK